MTIIKISGDKAPYKPPEPEIGDIPVKEPATAVDVDPFTSAPVGIAVRKPGQSRRCTGLATLLLVISCGIITVGLITGLYLWHQSYGPGGRGGFCGVTYTEGERARIFRENVHLPSEDKEVIDVPRFGHWQSSRILHDFSVKKTAIEDLDKGRCFIMDLDEALVKPPETVWDLIVKLRRGDYMPQEEVIRRTMRVDRGPLTLSELREFGNWIANACELRTSYTLERVEEADRILDREPRDGDYRLKRSVDEAAYQTAYYAGADITELIILDD